MKDTYPLRREKIGEEVFFSSLRDSRFKTDLLTLNFVLPLKRETVTENALDPAGLGKRLRKLPRLPYLFHGIEPPLRRFGGGGLLEDWG